MRMIFDIIFLLNEDKTVVDHHSRILTTVIIMMGNYLNCVHELASNEISICVRILIRKNRWRSKII